MSFSTLITTAGQAKIAAAIAGSATLTLSNMAVGDGGGSPVTPIAGMTALIHEVHRASTNRIYRDATNNALLYIELVIPSATGGFTVREAGVFSDDGTLIAVANLAATYKPLVSEGSASEMVVRMVINLGSAASVSLVVSGSVVTATQDWSNSTFLKKSENLADISDKPTAIANLGVVVALMQFMYPVGETLITSRTGNPSAWMGFGTWERVAAGRVLAGVDPADGAKDAAGKTFGANSVTLGTGNLPAHTHTIGAQSVNTDSQGSHTHSIDPPSTTTTGVADHAHIIPFQSGFGNAYYGFTTQTSPTGSPSRNGWNAGTDGAISDGKFDNTSSAGAHSHTVDIAPFTSGAAAAHAHAVNIPAQNTGSTGTGSAVDITPASYAVNIWKRTA